MILVGRFRPFHASRDVQSFHHCQHGYARTVVLEGSGLVGQWRKLGVVELKRDGSSTIYIYVVYVAYPYFIL